MHQYTVNVQVVSVDISVSNSTAFTLHLEDTI